MREKNANLKVFFLTSFILLNLKLNVFADGAIGGGSRIPSVTIGGVSIPIPSFRYNLSNIEGIVGLITFILNLIIGFSAVLAVIMIIYGGYNFIMSGGDSEKISKGSKAITAAVVGMAIVFLARFIITFILNEFLL